MTDSSGIFAATGWNGLFSIFVTLGCVVLAWIVLEEVNFDRLVKRPRSPRAKVLQMLVAVALGYTAAKFVLDYWNWAGMLRYLVQ